MTMLATWITVTAVLIAFSYWLSRDSKDEAPQAPDDNPPRVSPPPPAPKPCVCIWCPLGCDKTAPTPQHPADFQAFLDELNRQSEASRPCKQQQVTP